jgi:hypothetical protein
MVTGIWIAFEDDAKGSSSLDDCAVVGRTTIEFAPLRGAETTTGGEVDE